MITFRNVKKSFPAPDGRRVILRDFSGEFPPTVNVGVLGHNGAGKSTFMKLFSGNERPDAGHIVRNGSVSWPLGFKGGFHNALTGRQNISFISRIYRRDQREVLDFVEHFADIGRYIDMPVKTYSSGMKARLAFGASMAIDFDYYLIDEVITVGDAAFKKKCQMVLDERRKKSALIVISHSESILKEFSQVGAVLYNGELEFFETVSDAIRQHNQNQGVMSKYPSGKRSS